jgi:DNA-binding transcriptional LysR family regulator
LLTSAVTIKASHRIAFALKVLVECSEGRDRSAKSSFGYRRFRPLLTSIVSIHQLWNCRSGVKGADQISAIHAMDISKFDLNLLRVLLAVSSEKSASLAARKLGLSQPAVSSAINRLRKALNDPIVVRTRSGVLLTPSAERLAKAAEQALSLISSQLPAQADFDASVARLQFTVLMSDIGDLVATPDLIREARLRAPGVTLRVRAFNGRSYISELESGQADLVFGSLKRPHSSLMSTRLYTTPLVCLYRQGHPFAKKTITVEDYYNAHHILHEKEMQHKSMNASSDICRERNIAIIVPHYISIPNILVVTDLVVTVTEGIAAAFANNHPLAYQDVPFDAPPLSVSIFWHQRANNDEANRWLRRVCRDIFQKKQ